MKLTENEKKFLSKFEKNIEKTYIYFTIIALSSCAAIIHLIIGIVLERREALLGTIIFSGIAINIFFLSRSYRKLYRIISKMKQYINDLEKPQSKE